VARSHQGYDAGDGLPPPLSTTKEHEMSTTPQEPLKDEDIESTTGSTGPTDADGTDGADADGTDGSDGDATDTTDGDSSDGGDADGTDA
jgi:hypothetical protein